MKSVQEMSMDLKMEQWWVIFDVGGVLVNDAFPDCFHPLLASYPTEQRDQLLSIHRRNYDLWKRYRSDPQYKEEDYWADVVSRASSEQLKETVEKMKENLRLSFVHYQHTLDVLAKLANTVNVTLGVCSNNSTEWWEFAAEKLNLSKYFPNSNFVIISQEVECSKPERQIWQILSDRLENGGISVPKNKVIFIDDKLANVESAKEFGFTGIHYDARKTQDLEDKLKAVGLCMNV